MRERVGWGGLRLQEQNTSPDCRPADPTQETQEAQALVFHSKIKGR